MSSEEELKPARAKELITGGAPTFTGHKRPVTHRSENYFRLYATSDGNGSEESDVADLHASMTQLMTLRLQGSSSSSSSSPHRSGGRGGSTSAAADRPWETLEQPSCAFLYGRLPGTITLNQWATVSSVLPTTIPLRDPGVVPREVNLEQVFDRLQELEHYGLDEGYEDRMYKSLYKRFLHDPDKLLKPHRTLDRQITDLIMVLSRPKWIDFSKPENQVVTRFIYGYDDRLVSNSRYLRFFHQLLLSIELDARLNARQHGDLAKERLLPQIPPTIQWDLALARRWREGVSVKDFGRTPDQGKEARGNSNPFPARLC
jgi:hypothetical protein